jgi:hypothetical protein
MYGVPPMFIYCHRLEPARRRTQEVPSVFLAIVEVAKEEVPKVEGSCFIEQKTAF